MENDNGPTGNRRRYNGTNQKHIGNAHGTPLTIPPLSNAIDYQVTTVATELILNGTFSTQELDDISARAIQQLERKLASPKADISPIITMSQFKRRIKVWRESTSTSPSGLGLPHLHSLWAKRSLCKVSTPASKAIDDEQE